MSPSVCQLIPLQWQRPRGQVLTWDQVSFTLDFLDTRGVELKWRMSRWSLHYMRGAFSLFPVSQLVRALKRADWGSWIKGFPCKPGGAWELCKATRDQRNHKKISLTQILPVSVFALNTSHFIYHQPSPVFPYEMVGAWQPLSILAVRNCPASICFCWGPEGGLVHRRCSIKLWLYNPDHFSLIPTPYSFLLL